MSETREFKKEYGKPFTLTQAPLSKKPLIFDLSKNRILIGEDDPELGDTGTALDLSNPNSVCQTKDYTSNPNVRPQWIKEFFKSIDKYVQTASKEASVDPDTGELQLSPSLSVSELKSVCTNLTWLYESQHRQNKEILVWIGEVILDYIARSPMDLSIEEAIEQLGFLKRANGFKWKMKTLVKWVVVAQKISPEVRQLPVAPSYLSEAAMFASPEDVGKKVQFENSRDALLMAIAEEPEEWSRAKFVACMKELQDVFGMERKRNEGTGALRERLIYFYRLREETGHLSEDQANAMLRKVGITRNDLGSWIYNIEAELIYRGSMEPDPFEGVRVGDGLTDSARNRVKAAASSE